MEMDSTTTETEDIVFMASAHRTNNFFFIEDVYYQLDVYNNMVIEIHYGNQDQRDEIIEDFYECLSTEVFLDSVYLVESAIFISGLGSVYIDRNADGGINIRLRGLTSTRKYSIKLEDLNLLGTNEYKIYKASKRNKFIDNILNG